MKIISYDQFKKTSEYSLYSRSVEVNMSILGYACILSWQELDAGENKKESAATYLKCAGITKGQAVVYSRRGDCGLYYLWIFFKEGEIK